jgi:predicted transcriptional regulator
MAVEKKEMKEKTVVVKELPVQNVKELVNEEEGTKYTLITTEEALTEILERLARIENRQR